MNGRVQQQRFNPDGSAHSSSPNAKVPKKDKSAFEKALEKLKKILDKVPKSPPIIIPPLPILPDLIYPPIHDPNCPESLVI